MDLGAVPGFFFHKRLFDQLEAQRRELRVRAHALVQLLAVAQDFDLVVGQELSVAGQLLPQGRDESAEDRENESGRHRAPLTLMLWAADANPPCRAAARLIAEHGPDALVATLSVP